MVDLEQGNVLYASPAYETVWASTGRSLLASFRVEGGRSPQDRAMLERVIARQSEGYRIAESEYRILRPNGEIRWIRDLSFPIADASGKLYRVAGVAEDITDRRHAESELRTQQMRLEGIVNSAMDGIITVDSRGRA